MSIGLPNKMPCHKCLNASVDADCRCGFCICQWHLSAKFEWTHLFKIIRNSHQNCLQNDTSRRFRKPKSRWNFWSEIGRNTELICISDEFRTSYHSFSGKARNKYKQKDVVDVWTGTETKKILFLVFVWLFVCGIFNTVNAYHCTSQSHVFFHWMWFLCVCVLRRDQK